MITEQNHKSACSLVRRQTGREVRRGPSVGVTKGVWAKQDREWTTQTTCTKRNGSWDLFRGLTIATKVLTKIHSVRCTILSISPIEVDL